MNRSYTTSNHRRGKIIERTVTELKTIIRDIILEVGELKERVALLELAINNKKSEYTEQLPGELSTAGEAAYAAQANNAEHNREDDAPCAYSLKELYQDGRHVCPMAYGEERTEGCLFCAAMLSRGEE
ncbi:MAG: DUF972 family protein [Syntrophomonadaceae bacterium]|mgnify:CR=1 FL=1|jgi:regulator of replication initiation timing|nr:DUF972 family protein [Syntrophomonadaceae bacterium]